MARRRGAEREFSAGGVVTRDGTCVVIVPTRRGSKGQKVLTLPKGHPDGKENAAQAATREIREETGIEAELVDELGDAQYWYQRDGRRIRKTVRFFLFHYRSGSTDDHDDEVEEVRWVPLEQAARELSYDGEREIVRRALARSNADR